MKERIPDVPVHFNGFADFRPSIGIRPFSGFFIPPVSVI